MVKQFSADSSNPNRALQVWQILISKAHNRQTVTYINLANMIGYSDARPIPNILELIMRYCDQNRIPPLTALVVNKGTGIPGNGLTTLKNGDTDREEVFNYDWYSIIPPTPKEFENAKSHEIS